MMPLRLSMEDWRRMWAVLLAERAAADKSRQERLGSQAAGTMLSARGLVVTVSIRLAEREGRARHGGGRGKVPLEERSILD